MFELSPIKIPTKIIIAFRRMPLWLIVPTTIAAAAFLFYAISLVLNGSSTFVTAVCQTSIAEPLCGSVIPGDCEKEISAKLTDFENDYSHFRDQHMGVGLAKYCLDLGSLHTKWSGLRDQYYSDACRPYRRANKADDVKMVQMFDTIDGQYISASGQNCQKRKEE